jgi:predicted DCC family thiol-disulfide oxidoreductase YuxK
MATEQAGPVIVFDALCLLCSGGAQFVLRRDRAARFRLAAVQSPAGAELCRRFGIDPEQPQSGIVVEGARPRRDSDAVLAVAAGLGWPWKAAAALRIVPRALRDPLYRWVARNRYRWFGKRATCWLPSPDQRARML